MAYIPVPLTSRVCLHCNTLYYAKDKRRMYCSSSCNTLAWMARKGNVPFVFSQLPEQAVKTDLSFSLENVATIAAGAGVANLASYIIKDAPFYERLDQRLKSIEFKMGHQAGIIDANQQYILNFIRAIRRTTPGVDQQMRLQEQHQKVLLLKKLG